MIRGKTMANNIMRYGKVLGQIDQEFGGVFRMVGAVELNGHVWEIVMENGQTASVESCGSIEEWEGMDVYKEARNETG